jgi:hypothetical protein
MTHGETTRKILPMINTHNFIFLSIVQRILNYIQFIDKEKVVEMKICNFILGNNII